MAGLAGIEPTTCRLGGGCAIRCATGPENELYHLALGSSCQMAKDFCSGSVRIANHPIFGTESFLITLAPSPWARFSVSSSDFTVTYFSQLLPGASGIGRARRPPLMPPVSVGAPLASVCTVRT